MDASVTQAEYVRIPHADTSLYPIPSGADEEALVMLSDVLPTAFECGVLNGKVAPGSTVAIVGAGPIGLAALLTALREHSTTGPLWQELVDIITVGETYFFRNNEQFRALAEVVLPERIRVHPLHKILRLLSAGCASGEEAYSMAIVTRETVTDPS